MAKGIDITIQALAKSKNKAAARLLDMALDSSHEDVRRLAGREVMSGHGKRGISELIRHFDPSDKEQVALFLDNREKAVAALRTAILGTDRQLSRSALRIANTQKFFELIPLLLSVFMDQQDDEDNSNLADAILRLLDKYVLALDERKNRRIIYGTVLPEVLKVVSRGVRDYHRNDPKLILQIYLTLYPYVPEEDLDTKKYVRNPSLASYLPIQQMLLGEDNEQLFHFVFHCMDNSNPPQLAMSVFAKRTDKPFLTYLFNAIQAPVSVEFEKNVQKIEHLAWMDQLETLLPQLREKDQLGLVQFIEKFGGTPDSVQEHLTTVFRFGRPAGRKAALKSLARISGERIDQIVWKATEDKDPEIVADALFLLKERNFPSATARIIQFVGNPNPKIHDAVQQLLPEFRFNRFLENFDQMTDDQRRISFNLVRKMDPQAIDELSNLLILGQPLEKAKALLCVQYGGIAVLVEEALCNVLSKGESPTLRCKAANLLAEGRRESSRGTLVQAFHRDPAQEVRDAAKASLEKRPTSWNISKTDKTPADDSNDQQSGVSNEPS